MRVNNEKILSICISTYNRAIRVEKIVKNLLNCTNNKFNIIVVDDCSDDDTEERLSMINDVRLSVYRNKTNLGAMINWYETLEKGNGKYLLHILDRDWVHSAYIDSIIKTLEKSNIGFGYIGSYFSSNMNEKRRHAMAIYENGEEGLCEFACTLVHPTGFLIRRDCWENIGNRKSFFEKIENGIYPHSYIFALLARDEKSIAIRYRMFEISSFSNMGRNISCFYKGRKLSYWWTPEGREHELSAIVKFVSDCLDIDINLKKKVLLNRFKENIIAATQQYKNTSKDIENSRHYDIPIKYVDSEELLKINNDFMKKFIDNVENNCPELCDEGFVNLVHIIAKENGEAICADDNLSNKEKQIVKFKEYYYLMDAWLELYQNGIRLSNTLLEQGIKTVAIYGNGKFGKKLRGDLSGSQVKVKYIIDKNAERFIEDVPVFSIIKELPKVDAIVVTIPDSYRTIRKELLQVCDYLVVSLEDIVYSSFEY